MLFDWQIGLSSQLGYLSVLLRCTGSMHSIRRTRKIEKKKDVTFHYNLRIQKYTSGLQGTISGGYSVTCGKSFIKDYSFAEHLLKHIPWACMQRDWRPYINCTILQLPSLSQQYTQPFYCIKYLSAASTEYFVISNKNHKTLGWNLFDNLQFASTKK